MTKPLLAALFFLLVSVACSKSPHERGFALGQQHAEQLRAKTLTFDKFTADLNDGVDEDAGEQELAEFRRGYGEGVAPARVELAGMIAGEAAAEGVRTLGVVTEQVVTRVRAELEGADRAAIREAGKKTGDLIRLFQESADEFQKGLEEGAKKGN